ncbi:hypothetical protein ACJJTC_011751 [Scirpophaga incertulas]
MKYWADNGGEGGRPWKLNSRDGARTHTCLFFAGGCLIGCLIIYAATAGHVAAASRERPVSIRADVWRSINLSARECKEDWFPTGRARGERSIKVFRPRHYIRVLFHPPLAGGRPPWPRRSPSSVGSLRREIFEVTYVFLRSS